MAYIISFGHSEDLTWMIANRHADWLINRLTSDLIDHDLVEYINVTLSVNGVFYDSSYGNENNLRDKYLALLKSRIPQLVEDGDLDINIKILLKDLIVLLNKA